jgi:PadR family transcriptional regulator, regulatory protein AphA
MAREELGKTAYTVLGMLRLGPRTGYEIKSLVDVSTRFFWAASYGQIYPELNRLERLGLVRGERDDSDGRRRKAYELTADGERALAEWLTSDAPLHSELRHEGLLKLFFSDVVDVEHRVELLRAIRAENERIRDRLREIEPRAEEGRDEHGHEMPLFVLHWGIEYHEFIAGWCERMERELSERVAGERS